MCEWKFRAFKDHDESFETCAEAIKFTDIPIRFKKKGVL